MNTSCNLREQNNAVTLGINRNGQNYNYWLSNSYQWLAESFFVFVLAIYSTHRQGLSSFLLKKFT